MFSRILQVQMGIFLSQTLSANRVNSSAKSTESLSESLIACYWQSFCCSQSCVKRIFFYQTKSRFYDCTCAPVNIISCGGEKVNGCIEGLAWDEGWMPPPTLPQPILRPSQREEGIFSWSKFTWPVFEREGLKDQKRNQLLLFRSARIKQ